ncbi:hypothetical protein [Galbibacter mesophilus]|uniref:hypothetical protein n=1 Tax=Galbibacter mesophilus TaxID=379069 RepID=UPI00191FDAC7|nr:hypothetical protein [Galbibacter mesophilus]MCM5661732.1 hypothetical protein [Galbibacter mesophilus]
MKNSPFGRKALQTSKLLTKLTSLSLLIIAVISCEKEEINETSNYGNLNNEFQALHDLKENPTTGGGNPSDDEGGPVTNPDNPNDYDPNPDGIGDIDYPGLNPNNQPPDGDQQPNPETPTPDPYTPGTTPNPPLHDFEHAD